MSGDVLGSGHVSAMDSTLLQRIRASRLLPVVVLADRSAAVPLGTALLSGGLPVAEVTFRTSAAADSIRAMVDAGLDTPEHGNLLIGAGTVVTAAQVDSAVGAGARFVVSPGLSRAVVERCQEHGVLVLPGTATATEVQSALTMGLRTVKFFPAESSGGVAAIKALSGPFPQMAFIPTGGIKESNVGDYLGTSAVLAVGGSWMVPGSAVAAGDFATIQRLTAAAVAGVSAS